MLLEAERVTTRPGRDEKKAWTGYPPEETEYEAFVEFVLRRVAAGNITHGIIDFTSQSEGSAVLRGKGTGELRPGWCDPDLTGVGSATREVCPPVVLSNQPFHVTLRQREFSLVTLKVPTRIPGNDSPTFYSQVITRLLALPPERDNLYGWLDVMFEFCRRQPLVYYSQYVPGPRVLRLAWRHGVSVFHRPLTDIPTRLRERHSRFRFLRLTRAEWDALIERLAAGESPLDPPAQDGRATQTLAEIARSLKE